MSKALLFLAAISAPTLAANHFRYEIPEMIFDQGNYKNCKERKLARPQESSGYKLIFPLGFFGPSKKVYCDQKTDGGGWTMIQNYRQKNNVCLSNFVMESFGCASQQKINNITIDNIGIDYSEVRGNVVIKQYASLDGFNNNSSDIESAYMDGASFTVEDAALQRTHIYSYAIGIYKNRSVASSCPSEGGDYPPDFVGSNYFCDSGNSDNVWLNKIYDEPLFVDKEFLFSSGKEFSSPISLRLMRNQSSDDENIVLQSYYVLIR
tara:strand:+ start:268 stop:1059 length:792 start_codon:yes stop_codon:yes gene_type:complete